MNLSRYVRLLIAVLALCLGWASSAQAAIPASERQVLLDLYASTNGAGWTKNTGWLGAAGTECTWHGVNCDSAKSHVTIIFLGNNNLTGSIPSFIGLTFLQGIWISDNQLSGSIPSLSGLTSLKTFYAQHNQLTGSIPSITGLTALTSFAVNDNQLTGSIPSLDGSKALFSFVASDNQLTGSIPSLNGLTALWGFYVDNNQLTGPIPTISGLSALQYFSISNNQLTGSVPAAPASLLAGQTNLCGNSLSSSGDTAIDAAWVTAQYTGGTVGSKPAGVADGNWLACQTTVNNILTVTISGTGSDGLGTVTSSPAGINCGADCTESYASGSSVVLTAIPTPASGNFFAGWSGACSGAGSCVVTMDAAKNVTATFKPEPFVATTVKDITATSATITTTITFDTPDVGKSGAVYIAAWVPSSALGALGILAAPMNHALNVTTTHDNPYLGGKINTRQETLDAVLAAADPNVFVLVQLTSTGWQLVENGQLIPYVSGVLGDSMAALSILNNANPANLAGAQFCVGYGTSAAEMIASGRMIPVATIDSGSTVTTSGSCNVAASVYDRASEFYHAGINHYFMTAYMEEAASLDSKPEWNWARTSKTFNVWLTRASAPSNASPVCRFFGVFANGTVGSHFYTADAEECANVKSRLDWGWNYEGDAFYAVKPTGSTCPSGTSPVYRVYNNGMGGAPNHRYMASQTDVATMVSQGWVSEGTGLAFCGAQ